MGKVSITVDDLSPQISYIGTWIRDAGTTGSSSKSFQGTLAATQTLGDSASFKFNGTSIALYGTHNSDHGTFSVKLDSNDLFSANGLSSGQEIGQELFRADNLAQNQTHQITITNSQQAWLDLDYIVFQAEVGADSEQPTTTVVDDAAGVFVLNPENKQADPTGVTSWQTQSSVNQVAYNNTFTATTIKDYTVTIPFQGSSVQVFGGISNNHGSYAVSLDGGQQQLYSGTTVETIGYVARQQIFGASGLTDGAHSLVFTNMENKWFDVDYAVFNSSRSTSTNSTAPNVSGSPTKSKSTPIAAIVAPIVAVVAIAAIALGVFFLLRRRRRRQQDKQGHLVDMDSIDGDDGPPSMFVGGSSHLTTPGDGSAPQLVNLTPTPFVYSADSTAGHVDPSSSADHDSQRVPNAGDGLASPNLEALGPPASTMTSNPWDRQDSSASGTVSSRPSSASGPNQARPNVKSGLVAATPPTSVGGERMRVRGREQDAGPIAHPEEEEDDKDDEMLPPDYHQAIEPIDRR